MKKEVLSSDNVYEIQAISETLKSDNNQKQRITMKCPECGAEMVRTPDKILTSKPPMYELKCPKCGAIRYQFTHIIDPDYAEFKEGVLMEMPDPWWEFRVNAAKDILCAMITHSGTCANPKDDNSIRRALDYADELIEQLKQGK